ncbi:MAG: hypothetical protein NUV73_01920, partial [Candidatus Daviesbacteria bacterium]|nr:hypothetical protein [Candidatus Daviesbacteria bacterium]
QLLEGSSLTEGTPEEKIDFAKKIIKDFDHLSRDELLEQFKERPEFTKLYYLLRIGQNTYSVTDKYTYEMFEDRIKAIRETPVEEQTLSTFQAVLEHSGLTQAEASALVKNLQEGKPPIRGEDRTVTFLSEVEYGSSYEKALRRLQEVWLRELKSLLVAKTTAKIPVSITESVALLDNQNLISEADVKLYKIIKTLKLDSEYIGKPNILEIVKDLKNRLKTIYKQTGDKESFGQLDTLSDYDVIKAYLQDLLPDKSKSPATTEWLSHLNEVLIDLTTAKAMQRRSREGKRLGLTFLDKNKDFIRAIRFADAAQCCFNSASDTTIEDYASRYPVRLNKDPLSFIMDLKEENSNEILGFIFGRMGINPKTGKPVIMLNGIYSQVKGESLGNNILSIIEEKMAPTLHADTIAIASQYGGTISQPEGYQNGTLPLFAIRALGSDLYDEYSDEEDIEDENGYEDGESYEVVEKTNQINFLQNPDGTYTYRPNSDCEKYTYDDIGNVANGLFNFKGYYKQIPVGSSAEERS